MSYGLTELAYRIISNAFRVDCFNGFYKCYEHLSYISCSVIGIGEIEPCCSRVEAFEIGERVLLACYLPMDCFSKLCEFAGLFSTLCLCRCGVESNVPVIDKKQKYYYIMLIDRQSVCNRHAKPFTYYKSMKRASRFLRSVILIPNMNTNNGFQCLIFCNTGMFYD